MHKKAKHLLAAKQKYVNLGGFTLTSYVVIKQEKLEPIGITERFIGITKV